MMERKSSVGVTVFGIMMLIYSIWFLGGILFDYDAFLQSSFLIITPTDFTASEGGWILPPLVGIIFLISSIGILKLKSWARKLAVYFSAFISFLSSIILLLVFVSVLRGEAFAAIAILYVIPFIPAIIFLFFFTRPKVKRQFVSEGEAKP